MTKNYDVIIIGGGIVGLFTAYYLERRGSSVLVLDKGPTHRASSHGNCGLISPSHIVPLNKYSLILKTLWWLFKKDAPFRIKPRWDPQFIGWAAHFLRNASTSRIYRNTKAVHDLIVSSRQLYQEVFDHEKLDCNWSDQGIHLVFKSEKGFRDFKQTNQYTSRFGVAAEPIFREQLLEKEPALRDDVFGSWFFDIDGWLRPDYLVRELKDLLQARGVEILAPKKVTDFSVSEGLVKSVKTMDGDSYQASQFVLATGAWSPLLQEKLSIKLPIVPGKGYSITMKSPSITPKVPCIMAERQVVATPWNGSYRLGSTMEFAGYDETLNRTRLEALKRSAAEYLKEPYTSEIEEEWFGWRPMTYDGVPIISRSPKQKNLVISAGHSMLGLSMATGTGKLVTEILLDEEPHIELGQYAYKN